jgi:hypothetical protein
MKITRIRLMELAGLRLPSNEGVTKAQMTKGIGLPIEDYDELLPDLLARAKALGMTQGPSPRITGKNEDGTNPPVDFFFDYDDPSGAEIYTGEEDVAPSVLYILNPKMQNDSEIKSLVNDLDQALADEEEGDY